jgi:hypothetical protein
MTIEGGCFCGDIRYRVSGPVSHETCCHCSQCRRSSGAPFVAWFSVRRPALQLTSGTPTEIQSSDHGTRSFCSRCGTALLFRSSHFPDELDVTICSLDSPEQVPPIDHTQTRSRLSWIEVDTTRPSFTDERSVN